MYCINLLFKIIPHFIIFIVEKFKLDVEAKRYDINANGLVSVLLIISVLMCMCVSIYICTYYFLYKPR